MADINPTLSVMILNENMFNQMSEIGRTGKKKDPNIGNLKKTGFILKDTNRLKATRQKNIIYAKGSHKRTGVGY